MNNIYKILIWLSLAIACVALILSLTSNVTTLPIGGVTNYDSLQLQSEVSSDNVLDIRDTSGTSKFTIDGSGNITTWSGTVSASGAFTLSGELNTQRIIEGGTKTTLTATSTATTLTAAQVCNSAIIEWDVSGTSSTLSMASTSLVVADCSTQTGDSFRFLLRNISGSGEYITVAADDTTSMTLREPSGGDVIIQNAESAFIDYYITLASSTDSTSDVVVTSLQEAD